MDATEEADFCVSFELGSLLIEAEKMDIVLNENVVLNDYIPTLSGPAPSLRNKATKKSLIDLDSISRASIRAAQLARKSTMTAEQTKNKEKETLLSRQKELESLIDQQQKSIVQLRKKKDELEQQLSDQRTRSRLGSRTSLSVSGLAQSDGKGDSNMGTMQDYWKQQYETIHRQYTTLLNQLKDNGSVIRISNSKVKTVNPKPTPTFESPDDEDNTF